jgi:hypothetical protein
LAAGPTARPSLLLVDSSSGTGAIESMRLTLRFRAAAWTNALRCSYRLLGAVLLVPQSGTPRRMA